ncbi:MAG: hypothetical protein ACYS0I_10480 [Planctomycetota bacterium]|jgi:hypothetical protein
MTVDSIIPDLAWCRKISRFLGEPTRCPFARVELCPRYYQSVSLLDGVGHDDIPPKKDRKLKRKWEKSDLWPMTGERATSVSGTPGLLQSFSNLCPEAGYDNLGYFGSEFIPDTGELVHLELKEHFRNERISHKHWIFKWAYVSKMHYTECPLYLPLKEREKSKKKKGRLFQKLTKRVKNNPITTILILISILIIGLGSLTDALMKIQTWLSKLLGVGP